MSFYFSSEKLVHLVLAVLGLRCCGGFLWFHEPGLLRTRTVQAPRGGGFSPRVAWALGHRASVVSRSGFSSTGSIVAAHGLSCSAACGILLDQGSNPSMSLPLAGRLFATEPPGKPHVFHFASATQHSAQKCLLPGRQDIVLK